MKKGTAWLPVSRLKGIGVYYEDDLHDLALLILKVSDAHSAYKSPNIISRPTLNGLAREFASLIDACNPDYGLVLAVIEKHGLPLGATVEFDDRLRGSRRAPRNRVTELPASQIGQQDSQCRAENVSYTCKQGQYLAFIYHYTKINRRPPAEADIQSYFRASPPATHQMIVKLEEKGLISRVPGQARTIKVLVPLEDLPPLE